ncbi:MAG: hypothetical protein OEZ32_10780 [Nitrospinota bacterium]|nr:hypothetical protein [Nitrospinota bacterium]
MPQKSAGHTSRAMADRLGSIPARARLSITYDHGSESVEHEAVNAKLGPRHTSVRRITAGKRERWKTLAGLSEDIFRR